MLATHPSEAWKAKGASWANAAPIRQRKASIANNGHNTASPVVIDLALAEAVVMMRLPSGMECRQAGKHTRGKRGLIDVNCGWQETAKSGGRPDVPRQPTPAASVRLDSILPGSPAARASGPWRSVPSTGTDCTPAAYRGARRRERPSTRPRTVRPAIDACSRTEANPGD